MPIFLHIAWKYAVDPKSFMRQVFESWKRENGIMVLHGNMKKVRTGRFLHFLSRISQGQSCLKITKNLEIAP